MVRERKERKTGTVAEQHNFFPAQTCILLNPFANGVVGKVVFVKLLQGADGRPRGQARVRMKSPEEAKAALALDGREFGGRVLKVQADERRNVG